MATHGIDPQARGLALQYQGSGGSAQVGFLQSGTGADVQTLESKLQRTLKDAGDFSAVADGTTQTAKVQELLTSTDTRGNIPMAAAPGVKFNLATMTFPRRTALTYRLENETDTPGFSSGGSGEVVLFLANSSYAASPDAYGNGPTGAAVNEQRVEAPLHPAFVVDVRKTLSGHDAYLAPSQSRTEPARASYNLQDDRNDIWRVVYENYQTYNTFSGVKMHTWRRRILLNGIGTAQWSSVPALGTIVTGTTSGAKGHVVSVAAGYTELELFSGTFQAGETVSDNNETTSATISTTTGAASQNAGLACSTWTGAWTFGDMPARIGEEVVNVSGNIRLTPTRGTSVNNPKTVTKPSMLLGLTQESGTKHQIGIQYDPGVKTDATRRLTVVRGTSETWTGELVPISAAASFGDAGSVDSNAVNVASITKSSTGRYDIVYSQAVVNAYGMSMVSVDGFYMGGWTAGVTFNTTSGCTVRVYDTTNTLADIPGGAIISFVMMGADV